ncbi:hypothetical protein ACFX13_039405 [Malus domestica]
MFCSHRQSRGGKGNSMAVEQLKIGREQGVFSRVDDEILQNILGRLPGVEFSSAVGVNTNWNKNFGQMLSRPKFSSALSLNPDLHNAIDEVLDEVFSKANLIGLHCRIHWNKFQLGRNSPTYH